MGAEPQDLLVPKAGPPDTASQAGVRRPGLKSRSPRLRHQTNPREIPKCLSTGSSKATSKRCYHFLGMSRGATEKVQQVQETQSTKLGGGRVLSETVLFGTSSQGRAEACVMCSDLIFTRR